jgi:hypothetical protein
MRNKIMKLKINKETTVQNIQSQFNDYYPYLKIEFFKNFPKNKPILKAEILNTAETLKDLDSYYEGREIDVDRNRSVKEMTKDFENMFGLSAHVFRKSGNVWVETSLTEDWALGDQNDEGQQISDHFN